MDNASADGSAEYVAEHFPWVRVVRLAHNTGFVEIWYGDAAAGKLEIATDAVARTETAKEYAGGKRLYGNVEGDLLYAFDMAAMLCACPPASCKLAAIAAN